jgi:predicted RecA/RadA family phage recombinase
MKKYIFVVIAIVALVVAASGCTSQNGNGNNSTTTKNYSNNSISFSYPANWEIISENSSDNGTVVAVGDADIQKNNTTTGNGVVIFKLPNNANNTADLNTLKTQVASLNGTNSTVNIGGITANVTTFNTTADNVTGQIRLIDFTKGDSLYFIQYTTLSSDFQTQSGLFDIITKSFSV